MVGAIELVHELAEYLSRRYPTTFRVTSRHSALGKEQRRTSTEESTTRPGLSPQEVDTDFCDWGWDGQPPIKCIHVVATGETHELPLHSKDGQRAPERALEIASLLCVAINLRSLTWFTNGCCRVSEDLAIMIEGTPAGDYNDRILIIHHRALHSSFVGLLFCRWYQATMVCTTSKLVLSSYLVSPCTVFSFDMFVRETPHRNLGSDGV